MPHVASPSTARNLKDDEPVWLARDGTLRVLAAAKKAGVQWVIMTSSIADVAYGRGGRSTRFTEADWSYVKNLKSTFHTCLPKRPPSGPRGVGLDAFRTPVPLRRPPGVGRSGDRLSVTIYEGDAG